MPRYLSRRLFAVCFVMLPFACRRSTTEREGSDGTPAGEVLLKTDFEEAQGGPPPDAQTTSEHHEKRLALGEGVEVDVILDVAKDARSGARYLEAVEVRVVEASGKSLSAAIPSGASPVNLGSRDVFVASLPMLVSFTWSEGLKNSARSTMVTLVADGSVDVP